MPRKKVSSKAVKKSSGSKIDISFPKNEYQKYIRDPKRQTQEILQQQQFDQNIIAQQYALGNTFYARLLEDRFRKKYEHEPVNIDREIRINKLNEKAANILQEIFAKNGSNQKLDNLVASQNIINAQKSEIPAPLQSQLTHSERKSEGFRALPVGVDTPVPQAPDLNLILKPMTHHTIDKPEKKEKKEKKEKESKNEIDEEAYKKMFTRFTPDAGDLQKKLKSLQRVQKDLEKEKQEKPKRNYHPLGLDMKVLQEAKNKLKNYNENQVEDFDQLFKEPKTPKAKSNKPPKFKVPGIDLDEPESTGSGIAHRHYTRSKKKKKVRFAGKGISTDQEEDFLDHFPSIDAGFHGNDLPPPPRFSGSGSHKKKNQKVISTAEFELVPRSSIKIGHGFPVKKRIEFGQFELSEPDLKEHNIMLFRFKKNKQSVRDLPGKKVSDNVRDLILAMDHLRQMGDSKYADIISHPILQQYVNRMNASEIDEFLDDLGRSHLYRDKEYRVLKAMKNKKKRLRLELLLSAIDSGNDSEEVRKEALDLVYYLRKHGSLNFKQADELVAEIQKAEITDA